MGSKTRPDLESFHNYEVLYEDSVLYMGSISLNEGNEEGVNCRLAENAIKNLYILDRKKKDITIVLNNIGGDFYHALAIYDAIRACKNKVTIIVYGHAMSAGVIILQAADERVLMPNATIMIHDGEEGYVGHHQNFIKAAKQAVVTQDKMYEIIAEGSGVNVKKVKEMCSFDTYMSAKEAVEFGLADKVMPTRKGKKVRR